MMESLDGRGSLRSLSARCSMWHAGCGRVERLVRPRRSRPAAFVQRATSWCSSAVAATAGAGGGAGAACAVAVCFAPRRLPPGSGIADRTLCALLRFARPCAVCAPCRRGARALCTSRRSAALLPSSAGANRRHRAGARFVSASLVAGSLLSLGALPHGPRQRLAFGVCAARVPHRRALLADCQSSARSPGIVALGGLAPRVHKSGRTDRRRGLAPGRSCVKVILFNPARTASGSRDQSILHRLRARAPAR